MAEALKTRLQFNSPVIQAQTVRNLVAAVLKENGSAGKITAGSTQGPALQALWDQCCTDCCVVRSSCCEALVLLVDQDHADLHHVLSTVLNLLPSARNFQGLVKVLSQLLQLQVERSSSQSVLICPYSIRSSPHPLISALENRSECWSALLLEVGDFVQRAVELNAAVYVTMLEPFLRYLYCEPQRLSHHALLRHSLLRALLPVLPGGPGGPGHKDEDQKSSAVSESLLLCLCQLVPHMQVDSVEALLELCGFVDGLVPSVLAASGYRWAAERTALLLQLLCACRRCLQLHGDCRPLVVLMQRLLDGCGQEVPVDQLIVGVSLLLLEAPAAQQTGLLSLAVSVLSGQTLTPPWSGPVLVLPLLQLLSCSGLTELLSEPQTLRQNQKLAHSLLQGLSWPVDPPEDQPGCPLSRPLTSWFSQLSVCLSVLHKVSRHPAAAADWLLTVGSAPPSGEESPSSCLVLILAHLIVSARDDVCLLALETTRTVAAADPCQVPALLPVLLFKLSREKNPVILHAVLNCLPHLGTHKFCVPLVLQTLLTLAGAPQLRAMALRLLTELWKKQDRVYPDLQRLLSQQDGRVGGGAGRDAQWELVLSRAACIRDICTERPYQHGGDMLAAVSLILKQCPGAELETPAALALQGLVELCRSEVVDIVSTWRTLGPELSRDSRPSVVKATAQLLALLPRLTVKSDQYQTVTDEAVRLLWSFALSQDPLASRCGYQALAEFPDAVHTVTLLPEAVRPVKKRADHEEEEEEEEEDLSVPGPSYVKLISITSYPVLSALEVFLGSLVKQEMSRMPRGVYFSALRGAGLHSDRGKTVAGIPGFLLKTYEKNQQPGLKPGLAAGMLLCFDVPVQTDREGRSVLRLQLSRSRSFQQTLTALLHEVNIQPSEWHRALLLPQAWRSFMSRAFSALLQGRRAELHLQRKNKQDDEELKYQEHCAWMWARDQLTDVIKAATKDSPVVQGNTILALSGLAAAVSKYESSRPADGDDGLKVGPEFVPTSSWLSIVLNTLLSIISSSFQVKGQVLPWIVHRSYSGENTASAIARSCASLALSLLVPVLVVWQKDSVVQVVSALRSGLPDQPGADESQAVQFHSGLALGLVLCRLHQQRLSDTSIQTNTELILTSLDALENCSFSTNLEYNTGCLLGLGLVLAALCSQSEAEPRLRVVQTLDKLLDRLRDSSGQGRMLQEVLAYSVACVGVSAFSGGLIDGAKAEEVMDCLRSLTEDSQQTPGLSLSLGLVVHGLSWSGHGKALDLQPRLQAAWIQILLAEVCPTMQRLAAVNGLVALVGSESYLVQVEAELQPSAPQQNRLNEVIRAVTQVLSASGAIGLQSNSACLLAHLHLSQVSSRHSNTAVPQDFSYLPESSVIRAIVDFLSEAGKSGPEFCPPAAVQAALTPLAAAGASFQFPPVNWNAVLSPLMRLGFGDAVQRQCVSLAASQAPSSQNAAVFLEAWICPPLVHTVHPETGDVLYETLGSWMKLVPQEKLRGFLETLQRRPALSVSLLQGLARAMALPNPPNPVWTVLCSSTLDIYNLLPHCVKDEDVDLYVGVASCLSEMSDMEIDRIAGVSEAEDEDEKSCLVLCLLTSRGRIPLLGLNDLISAAIRRRPGRRTGWFLLQTFYQSRLASGSTTGVSSRTEWLLELMGLLRNVAYGTSSVTCGDVKLATDFLFQLFSAAVVSWADHRLPLLLGVRAGWFPWKPDGKPPAVTHRLFGDESLTESALPQCILGLPHSLPLLLDKEPWSHQSHKFMDWLFSITEGPEDNLSSTTINTARAALLSLRSRPEFRKKTVWSRAYGW